MSVSSVGSNQTVSYLQSLLQPASAKSKDVSDPLAALFAAFTGGKGEAASEESDDAKPAGPSGCPQFSPGTMASLIALQGQQAIGTKSLLGQFDADGNGAISQSEFETAIGPDADQSKVDSLFGKIDGDSDGSISQDELQAAVEKAQQSQTTRGHHHRHHGMGEGQGQGGLASLLSATDMTGASSQTASNADGSTTTTISYADGSKVTMSVPAAGSSGESSTGKSGGQSTAIKNFIERLIHLQSQMLAQQAQNTSAVTV